MDLEKGKSFEKEELIQELIELVFEKAQKESKKKPIHGLASYLSTKFLENFQFSIDVNTFTRYYKGYILKNGKRQVPTDDVLNALCQYLDYTGFKDFEMKSEEGIVQRALRREIKALKKRMERITFIGLIGAVFLLGVLGFFVSKYYKKNCMVWMGDHYAKIRCSGLENERKLDEVVLLKMQKIENPQQCKHDLWYDKSDNKVSFFTYFGEHPTNGKTLKQVTEHICEKYILEKRDSVLAQNHTKVLDSLK